jgi:hypothetical protein
MVCATCGVEFASDRTATMLDVLNAQRASTEPVRQKIVPVYGLPSQ